MFCPNLLTNLGAMFNFLFPDICTEKHPTTKINSNKLQISSQSLTLPLHKFIAMLYMHSEVPLSQRHVMSEPTVRRHDTQLYTYTHNNTTCTTQAEVGQLSRPRACLVVAHPELVILGQEVAHRHAPRREPELLVRLGATPGAASAWHAAKASALVLSSPASVTV